MVNLVSQEYLYMEIKVKQYKFGSRNNLVKRFVRGNRNEKFLLIPVSVTFLVQKLNWCLM